MFVMFVAALLCLVILKTHSQNNATFEIFYSLMIFHFHFSFINQGFQVS